MIQVDEVYPSDIRRTIGPAGTIKRLFSNRDYFASRDYEMRIFVPQITNQGAIIGEMDSLPPVSNATKQEGGTKDSFNARKHSIVAGNRFLSMWSYNRGQREHVKLINQYIALGRSPDIIVFHDFMSCFLYQEHRKETKAKLVMFIHGPGDDDNQFSQRWPKLVGTKIQIQSRERLLKAFEYADEVVWISQNGKRIFLSNHPQYADKTSAVVNGINDMAPVMVEPSTNHKYRLVTTGTVCKRKGQYIIVEAMHRMNPEVLKDTHLTVIGIGADYNTLIEKTAEYGLQEHVTFQGNVLNAEIHKHLSAENIFVLMSSNEGLPISVIEAMRAGLPVISTRVDGIPEQVDERNGVLIDPNIDQLVEVLNGLPDKDWDTLGLGSRIRFENEYTFERMLCDYANMFDKLYNL